MNVSESEEEQPIAWTAIRADTPVYSGDTVTVGSVREVLGAEDIFHGLVLGAGTLKYDVEILADEVERITTRRIDVRPTAEEIMNRPPYNEEESFRLGFTGLFGRALGWIRDDGRHQSKEDET